jgi:hypothetical protein
MQRRPCSSLADCLLDTGAQTPAIMTNDLASTLPSLGLIAGSCRCSYSVTLQKLLRPHRQLAGMRGHEPAWTFSTIQILAA